MNVTCFIDYTCPYSHRAYQWLTRLQDSAQLQVAWATFSLKEANRDPSSPSPFNDPQVSSLSVLALALGHAARHSGADRYHASVFEAMHADGRRLDEPALLELAAAAGVDTVQFNRQRDRWLAAVAAEHRVAARDHDVFGTPTLVGDHASLFLKLSEVPVPEQDAELWNSLHTLACCHPELIEIKRTQTQN